mgnify:CR=1 FL=1
MKMKLSHFAYDLPKELIAQEPTIHRDDSRLMVVHKDTGEIEHKHFHEVIDYFDDGDVMVLNNTKVFPIRDFTRPCSTSEDKSSKEYEDLGSVGK